MLHLSLVRRGHEVARVAYAVGGQTHPETLRCIVEARELFNGAVDASPP